MTKKQFVDCAVRAGLVPSAAVDDAESYDGGATLHQLSVMWTAVCELQQDEPEVPQGWQVHVQRNVVGLDAGLGYPANVEQIPYGSVFDTKDAASLSVQHKGWHPLWWSVRPVPNRE